MLFKFIIDINNGNIVNGLCIVANINELKDQWTGRNTSSNWSSLKLHNDDLDKLYLINCKCIKKQKWLSFDYIE